MDEPQQIEWTGEISYAHFIHTDLGSPCYRIHGHNSKISLSIVGMLGGDGMVIDFRKVKEIVNEYDHKFLVPENNITFMPGVGAEITDGKNKIITIHTGYTASILCLNVPVVTAECLARNLANKILKSQLNIMIVECVWCETEKNKATYVATKPGFDKS